MRTFFRLLPVIFLFFAGIVACTPQPPLDKKIGSIEFYEFDTNIEMTLEDIKEPFGCEELNLKPQMEGEYPKLNDVESKTYELIDGMVYIHVFESHERLIEGKTQIKQVYEYEEWGLKVYEVNNMLLVYMPTYATDELIVEKHEAIIKAIKEMVENKQQ